jgi:hypothetical protein
MPDEVGFAVRLSTHGQGGAYTHHRVDDPGPGADTHPAHGLCHYSLTPTLTFTSPARVSIGAYTFVGVSLTSQHVTHSR